MEITPVFRFSTTSKVTAMVVKLPVAEVYEVPPELVAAALKK